jgi:hypothetical protein
MNNEANGYTVLSMDASDGEQVALTDVELGLILGGYEPGYNEQQNNPSGNALDLRDSAQQSSPLDTMTKDAGTIANYTDAGAGIGNLAGTIIGGPGSESAQQLQSLGAAAGTAFGIGVVFTEHFGEQIFDAGARAIEWVNSAEPAQRGNIP